MPFSGVLSLRKAFPCLCRDGGVTPELHRSLAMEAAEQGVSLNRLASAKLAG